MFLTRYQMVGGTNVPERNSGSDATAGPRTINTGGVFCGAFLGGVAENGRSPFRVNNQIVK